jgi:hypothetical protein
MKRFFFACMMALAGASPGYAQPQTQALTQAPAPVQQPLSTRPVMPARVSIAYNVIVRGVNAGEALYTFGFQGSDYQATARRQITGLARAFLGNSQDFSYSSRGHVQNGQVHPTAYRHEDDRRHRVVEVSFNGDEITTVATPRMGMGHPPATAAQKAGAIDQVSMFVQMLMAQGDPCNRTFRVFMDGRSRFDLVLRPNGTQRVSMSSYRGVAQRCTVQFTPIAGFSDPQEPARLTFLFATINGLSVPIVFEMPTGDVGVVRLEARRFQTAAT